ncbi:MAG: hypothetical protein EOO77_16770 [Oxalobacteraceae bacterium]|nr:MAG: hypothetical protein EOO77_16770 [Oxalobacteraceae bacterium]
MVIANIVLFVMVVVVYLEIPLQIFAKVVIWVMIAQSGTLTAKALYNKVVPVSMAYAVPLHPVEIAANTRSTLFSTTGTTRDTQGNPSGLKIDVSGVIENTTKRMITSVNVHCRWNYSATEEGRTVAFYVPVNVNPGQVSRFSYTYKTRSAYDAPSDRGFESRCHIKSLSEQDQWH